jgi:hypothetical protein
LEIFFLSDPIFTTDLFGEARALPSGKRGRPSHCWSQSSENRVILGLAMGYSDAAIADGLGISVPTLRKYYFSVLKRRDMQRTRFELWRAEILSNEANQGNVAAIRELDKIMKARDRHLEQERLSRMTAEKGPKLGKKDQRQQAAKDAAASDDLLRPGFGSKEVH